MWLKRLSTFYFFFQQKLWGAELRENIPRADFTAVMKEDQGKLSSGKALGL
jgi:hypothetical protein